MARSQNPMDAFRREQKKKELKKHQKERQKDKQSKLAELDVDEIRDRIKKLERQVQQNPADGPTRKRKQELEDTLNAALKKQKAMEEEQAAQEDTSKASMTLSDLNAANRERFQNPENSVYYHPVLNPFGAPPPGRPQMYRVPPPAPVRQAPQPRPQQATHSHGTQRGGQRGDQSAQRRPAHVPGPAKPQRPGKRPPLPSGPPPPGTIQIPRRPPLPGSAAAAQRAPPPPPAPVRHAVVPPPPPPPPSQPTAPSADVDMEDDVHQSVVSEYPPSPAHAHSDDDDPSSRHPLDAASEEDDDDRREKQAVLRSLVPTTLRVQRRPPPPRPVATPLSTLPRPPPPPSVPGPALFPAGISQTRPSTQNAAEAASSSVSSEFDAFMEEMKGLGAV